MPLNPWDFKRRLHTAINHNRDEASLQRIPRGDRLNEAAQDWSNHMADTKNLEHGAWIKRLRSHGVVYPMIGEVIAAASWSPEETVEAWMNSPEHRVILMNPVYDHSGVGAVRSAGKWWSVVDFGGS